VNKSTLENILRLGSYFEITVCSREIERLVIIFDIILSIALELCSSEHNDRAIIVCLLNRKLPKLILSSHALNCRQLHRYFGISTGNQQIYFMGLHARCVRDVVSE
jgi:hypothetical protein